MWATTTALVHEPPVILSPFLTLFSPPPAHGMRACVHVRLPAPPSHPPLHLTPPPSPSAPLQEILAAEQRNQVVSKLHSILKPFVLRRLKVRGVVRGLGACNLTAAS